jgi:hypothetical protein
MIICGVAGTTPGSLPQPPSGSPVVPSPVLPAVLASLVLTSPVSVAVDGPLVPPVLALVVGEGSVPPVCAALVVPGSAVPSDIPLEPAGPVLSVVVVVLAEDPSVQAASKLANNNARRIA